MTADAQTLHALDWTRYSCQCPCHRNPCSGHAAYVVHIHAIDRCNDPGLTPDGNRVELRCAGCLLTLRVEISYKLDRLNEWGLAACGTCGAPIASVEDVVRSVEAL